MLPIVNAANIDELLLINVAQWGDKLVNELELGAGLDCHEETDKIRQTTDARNLLCSCFLSESQKQQVLSYLLNEFCTMVLIPPINTYACCGSDTSTDTSTNIYDVPTSKRTAVADAINSIVASGGQAYLLESDTSYLGKVIVDNRTTSERTVITCRQQANFDTGLTECAWYRTIVE